MREYFYEHIDKHYNHAFIGGSITGFFAAIDTGHLLNVCLCAACGTIISFFISLILKKIFKTK